MAGVIVEGVGVDEGRHVLGGDREAAWCNGQQDASPGRAEGLEDVHKGNVSAPCCEARHGSADEKNELGQ